MGPETLFQFSVVNTARAQGWAIYHPPMRRNGSKGGWSEKGWPDLVLARPPRIVFAELKDEKGKVSPEQQAWIDRLRACGMEVYVWRPSQLAMIEVLLDGR